MILDDYRYVIFYQAYQKDIRDIKYHHFPHYYYGWKKSCTSFYRVSTMLLVQDFATARRMIDTSKIGITYIYHRR